MVLCPCNSSTQSRQPFVTDKLAITFFLTGSDSSSDSSDSRVTAQGLYSGGYALKNPEGASVDGRYEVNYLVVYSVV